jgi:hypothetical protein
VRDFSIRRTIVALTAAYPAPFRPPKVQPMTLEDWNPLAPDAALDQDIGGYMSIFLYISLFSP